MNNDRLDRALNRCSLCGTFHDSQDCPPYEPPPRSVDALARLNDGLARCLDIVKGLSETLPPTDFKDEREALIVRLRHLREQASARGVVCEATDKVTGKAWADGQEAAFDEILKWLGVEGE